MRLLNKVASWATTCAIYLILRVQEFWNKLNKKALFLTVSFWFTFVVFVKYFEVILSLLLAFGPFAILMGLQVFLLIGTYLLFNELTKNG